MQTFKSVVYLFITVFGLWMLASGPYSLPGLTDEGSWLILGLGLASTLIVVALCWAMHIADDESVPLHLTWRTLGYVPWLAVQVVLSNLDVMRRIWRGGKAIDPVVIQVRASQGSDLGRVTYANSITLTPGTLTIDAEDSVLTVHAISREVAKGLQGSSMDRRIRRLDSDEDGLGDGSGDAAASGGAADGDGAS